MLVHGMWSRPHVWDNFRQFFEARNYRVVVPALRHHDRSPDGTPHPDLGTTSLADYISDLACEIGQLDRKPLVIGQSMGGLLAHMLAARGLAFDLFMFHPQLGEAVELARSFPETTIVVNHAGGPLGVGRYATGISESRSVWRDALVRLAAEPNVVMKIGGLGMPLFGFGMEEREVPPTSEQLAAAWSATVDTCIEAFGSNRCMFESNLPPDGQSGRYVTIWNAYKRITSLASASEKADLYHGTAARTYDLVRPTTPQHA